jgi:hypothetical protein
MHYVSIQMEALMREEIRTAGDFCRQVVDLAAEVSRTVVPASFSAAKLIGLEGITLLHQDLISSADSACSIAHRGMQQLLEGEVAAMDSSSTIDLSAAAAERPSGTLPLNTYATCAAELFAAFSSALQVLPSVYTCRQSADCFQEVAHATP